MENGNTVNAAQYSPLTLAFMGDAVFELLVREELVVKGNRPVGDLHSMACARVCASAQAKAIKRLLPVLSEEETDVFKRGRNAHPGSVPKNQSVSDYHHATGLECLFGWLFLENRRDRITELFALISEFGDELNE